MVKGITLFGVAVVLSCFVAQAVLDEGAPSGSNSVCHGDGCTGGDETSLLQVTQTISIHKLEDGEESAPVPVFKETKFKTLQNFVIANNFLGKDNPQRGFVAQGVGNEKATTEPNTGALYTYGLGPCFGFAVAFNTDKGWFAGLYHLNGGTGEDSDLAEAYRGMKKQLPILATIMSEYKFIIPGSYGIPPVKPAEIQKIKGFEEKHGSVEPFKEAWVNQYGQWKQGGSNAVTMKVTDLGVEITVWHIKDKDAEDV